MMKFDAIRERHLDCMLQLALVEEGEREPPAPPTEEDMALYDRTWLAFTERWTARHRARRRRRVRQGFRRAFHAAACLALALVVAAPIALAGSGALRTRVMKLLTVSTPRYTALSLVPDEAASPVAPPGWRGNWFPTLIPEGFELVSLGDEFLMEACFHRADGMQIDFIEHDENAYSNIDTENAEITYETVLGREVMVVAKGAELTAVWSADDRYFILYYIGTEDNLSDRAALLDIVAGVRRVAE